MDIRAKRKKTDLRTLIICHIVGLLAIYAFSAFAHTIARTFPSTVTRLFLPQNLSLWEQGKLIYYPFIVIFFIEYLIVGRKIPNFIPIHLLIVFALPNLTYGLYHVHGFLFGNGLSIEGAHIILASTIMLLGFFLSYLMLTSKKNFRRITVLVLILNIALIAAYCVFTFNPPRAITFFDSINEAFGPVFH